MMEQLLHKYLVLHGQLVIPELGILSIKRLHSELDVQTGLRTAPRPMVVFSTESQSAPDKTLYDFLSRETGCDEASAIQDFQNFATRFTAGLRQQQTAVLPGVGTLFAEGNGHIRFEAATDLSALLPPILLPDAALLSDAEQEEEPVLDEDDNWWYYALILLILGVGALIYYYI